MRRPRERRQYPWRPTRLRRGQRIEAGRFSRLWMRLTGPGWHRGRQGTEWYRVPLESQQKRACHPWVFRAMS